jgi:hypothetical protein
LWTSGWLPIPREPRPFPSLVAASANDSLAALDRMVALAENWLSRLVPLGDVGHLNPASGFGPWPRARARDLGGRLTMTRDLQTDTQEARGLFESLGGMEGLPSRGSVARPRFRALGPLNSTYPGLLAAGMSGPIPVVPACSKAPLSGIRSPSGTVKMAANRHDSHDVQGGVRLQACLVVYRLAAFEGAQSRFGRVG